MIASLHGTLIFNDALSCIIECAGVGYRCYITSKTLGALPEKGKDVFLYTYMAVKEDSVDLYGFSEPSEMECFKLITSVSGVGPKIGIALLSALSADQIAYAVSGNDPKTLTIASGVGLKLAQRIILELKDKVSALPIEGNFDSAPASVVSNDSEAGKAVAALVSLGFTKAEATSAIKGYGATDTTEDIIKEALKKLARQV